MSDCCGGDARGAWIRGIAEKAAFPAEPPGGLRERAVETVARALYEADHWAEEWDRAHEQIRENCRRLAAAAIAAMPPSPAEEAVKRVEAVLVAAGPAPRPGKSWTVEVEAVRAALASPAPVTQDANGCPDQPHHGVDCPGDACRYAAAPAPHGEES